MATLARVLSNVPTPLAEVQPEVPVALGKLVDGLLVKDRAHRERDAMAVRGVLLAVADPDDGPVWAAAQVAVKNELSKGTPRPGSGSNSKRSSPGVLAMPGRTPSKPSNPTVRSPGRGAAVDQTVALTPSRRPLVLAGAFAVVAVLIAGAAFALWPRPPPPVPVAPDSVALPLKVAPDVPPPAPVPANVDVTLSADPKEARFVVDGEALSCNPCTLTRPPGTKLTVKAGAERFVENELEVVFDKPHETHVALAPVPSVPPAGKKPKKPKSLTVDEANPYR
jgi:hypothetical protein